MIPATSIAIAGATGLVGRHCLELALEKPDFDQVVVVTRRPLRGDMRDLPGSEKLIEHVVDLEKLTAEELPKVDHVICAIGTTIKKAGSKDRFREVDFGIPLRLARAARERGARHFLLVSALGAKTDSRVFYNRVKGELEDALTDEAFRSLTIVRPSLLLGDRDEVRIGEKIASRFGWLAPSRYKPIEAADVALALIDAARADAPGVRIIESKEMRRAAQVRP